MLDSGSCQLKFGSGSCQLKFGSGSCQLKLDSGSATLVPKRNQIKSTMMKEQWRRHIQDIVLLENLFDYAIA